MANVDAVFLIGCCRKDDAIWILTDYCGLGSMSDILELLSTPGTLIPGSIPLKRETIVVSKSSSQGTLLDERFEKERTMMESTWCQSGLTEMEVAAIVGGALEGLKFLHDKGIIHRFVFFFVVLICILDISKLITMIHRFTLLR